MPNRNSLDKLKYQQLLDLGIDYLVRRMGNEGTPASVRDHIALTIIGKAIPAQVDVEENITSHNIINIIREESGGNGRDADHKGETVPKRFSVIN